MCDTSQKYKPIPAGRRVYLRSRLLFLIRNIVSMWDVCDCTHSGQLQVRV